MDTPLLAVLQYVESDMPWIESLARQVLPEGRAERSGRSLSRRNEFFAGRAAVAFLLSRLGVKVVVEPDPDFGYLTLRPSCGLSVNLSHTTGIAIAAVGPSPLGVDVEALGRDTSRVIKRVSTQEELASLSKLKLEVEGRAVPAEVALWSAKEAVSKAIGLGIKFGMQEFVIGLGKPSPHPVTVGVAGPLAVSDPAVVFLVHDLYLISLCSERSRLVEIPRVVRVSART